MTVIEETLRTGRTDKGEFVAPGQPGSLVEVKPRYENFIGGHWVAPVLGQYMKNISPVTGKAFTEVAKSSSEDVDLALDAAHAAKDAWAETSLPERAAVLNAIADVMEAQPDHAGRRRELGERQAGA